MDIDAINAHLQQQLRIRGEKETTAVEAAGWLDQAGLLRDSAHRPGLPLRELLRDRRILGQRQESNHRWFIDRLDSSPTVAPQPLRDRVVRRPEAPGETHPQPATDVLDWDPRNEVAFKERGFVGFVPLGGLVGDRQGFLDTWANQLQRPGVYVVFVSPDWKPAFVTGRLPNVINPWSEQRLFERWIAGVDLIYVGCAGATPSSRTLSRRLGDLLKHGAGMVTASGPHKGGERLWQCLGWESFTLAWKATDPYPAPHDFEVAIGTRFLELTAGLPFANVRL